MWHSTFQLTNIVNLQSTSFLNFRAFCYLANYESAVYMEANKMKQKLMEFKKKWFSLINGYLNLNLFCTIIHKKIT